MAVVSKVYTPGNIFQGPADVFIDVTAPASNVPPSADVNEITLDASGQPTAAAGLHLGSTEGPAQVSITEKFNEIRDDQHESPIDLAFDTVEAEIDFNVKETTLSNLQKYLASDSLGAYTALAGAQVLQVGGQTDSSRTTRTLMLIAPRREAAGKSVYVFAHKAYLKSALQLTFHRTKENVHKLKFGVVADTTRVAGDEVMQIVRTK